MYILPTKASISKLLLNISALQSTNIIWYTQLIKEYINASSVSNTPKKIYTIVSPISFNGFQNDIKIIIPPYILKSYSTCSFCRYDT